MRVALDCMGGDKGPAVNVSGAIDAIIENPELTVLLVGDQDQIRSLLAQYQKKKYDPQRLEIHHAPEKILMNDSPAMAVRQKKKSSLHIANLLVKTGQAEAVFTAGNTGAAMAVSLLTLGRIPGVIRPALLINFPSLNRHGWTTILDVGANVDCKPKMLAQFAVMGDLYCRYILNVDQPRVGLLSLGEEESKGNDVIRESQELFKNFKTVRYIGNVEGQDMVNGKADVVVCDGFVGNVILKFGEGTVRLYADILKKEILASGWFSKLATIFLVPTMRRMYRSFDYQKYGSAPLLGIRGISTIGHGKSSGKAIKSALLQSAATTKLHINHQIEASLIENGVTE
ncbi:phosphate acyltransferase PlsX [candidate division FCPU426 bacterium]|nr:phosphate acyltransferase PlsX [candidate division FCPU426 bacterium]